MASIFNQLFKKKAQPALRRIYINDDLPERIKEYPNNKISNTKYNVITFLPKNLLEQFGRFMNLYFLLIACLQLWSVITPVEPISTWAPLVFIFSVSAIKEAFDDYKRFQQDKKANERKYKVLRNRVKTTVQAQDIRVGDIVFLQADDEIPCDLVLLSSSEADGTCFIQTANIDGETDYKSRQAANETSNLIEVEQLADFHGIIECSSPNADIYRFDSRMKLRPSEVSFHVSLSEKQLLLQATHLRNTEWVIGAAVYTGNETKVGQNKTPPPVKWTKQDRLINRFTIFVFCFQLSLVIVFGLIGNLWQANYFEKAWYLQFNKHERWYEYLIIPLRFLLLNSMMIPISLKVTMDIIKYAYAKFIDWDEQMRDRETNTLATATNTSISEDLGQVEFIFSDKTGTLTENKMIFSKCTINNVLYGHHSEHDNALYDQDLIQAVQQNDPHVIEFFKSLALCHTVVATKSHSHIVYKAASPDEEALVKAAGTMNVVYMGDESRTMHVSINGQMFQFERLQVLEFSSDRKRMSVILRNVETEKLILYIKGADDMMLNRLAHKETGSQASIHLEQFAKMGLRTLCVAYRELSEEFYSDWMDLWTKANTSMDNRSQNLSDVYDLVERDLILLGTTAIEDKLQEEVPETISILREAGIKIWMLTGDKYSTAVQIALSCNLISPSASANNNADHLLVIDGLTNEEVHFTLMKAYEEAQDRISRGREISVIIEGKTLGVALRNPTFLKLGLLAHTVICCRVTPHQKAQVVAMAKNAGKQTLAVGDGGNDVSMIQEAHVGIGILGREGLQAARAADYSIGKFRFLKRLILVHGRYAYIRTAFISQYCFYKSLFICFIQILYGFFNGFSGTTFFNTFSLTAYNIVFTSAHVVWYVLDKDLPERVILRRPKLYKSTQSSSYINGFTFASWVARAFLQAVAVFLITIFSYSLMSLGGEDGGMIDYISIGMVAYTSVVLINALTIVVESHTLTVMNHLAIWGTVASYFLFIFVMNELPTGLMYQVIDHLFSTSKFWFTVLLSIVVSILPVCTIKLFYSPIFNEKQYRRIASLHPFREKAKSSEDDIDVDVYEVDVEATYDNRPDRSMMRSSLTPMNQSDDDEEIHFSSSVPHSSQIRLTTLRFSSLADFFSPLGSRAAVNENKRNVSIYEEEHNDQTPLLIDSRTRKPQN